jgi:hypothetical protein
MDDIAALRELMNERDLRYQQRFDASQEALKAAMAAADRASVAALEAVKESRNKEALSAEKRFDLLNELRSGVATTEQVEALEKIVEVQGTRIQVLESEKVGARQLVTRVYAGIGAAVALIGMIVLFANGVFG